MFRMGGILRMQEQFSGYVQDERTSFCSCKTCTSAVHGGRSRGRMNKVPLVYAKKRLSQHPRSTFDAIDSNPQTLDSSLRSE